MRSPGEFGVVGEHEVLAADLVHDEIGDHVVVRVRGVAAPGSGVQPGDLVGGVLHLDRRHLQRPRDVGPEVARKPVEVVRNDSGGQRVRPLLPLQLKEEALPQIPGPDPRRVQPLDGVQHGLHLVGRVEGEQAFDLGDLLGPFIFVLDCVRVGQGRLSKRFAGGVEAVGHIFQRTREHAVVVDVADDLVRDPALPLAQAQEAQLLAQVVPQVAGSHHRRLVVVLDFALLALSADLEAVAQDLVPVHFGLRLRSCGLVLVGVRARIRIDVVRALGLRIGVVVVRVRELQEGVLGQLLLQAILKVEQGHVEQVHRLVQTRVGLLRLSLVGALDLPHSHAAHRTIMPRGVGIWTSCERSATAPGRRRPRRRSIPAKARCRPRGCGRRT